MRNLDARQTTAPDWLRKGFQRTEFTAAIDEGATFHFHERSFPAGSIELGGNTDDGQAGGKGNDVIAIAPLPLGRLEAKSTEDAALALLPRGDRDRGELLFWHPEGAGCFKCHRDNKILRPYFANVRLPDGMQVTRNHPPADGVDALDHDTMHPGIWLGFGDISGHDFWRNKGAIEHLRFVSPPTMPDGGLQFATECRLKTPAGEPLCQMRNRFTLIPRL